MRHVENSRRLKLSTKLPVIDFDSITQAVLEKYLKTFREINGDDSKIGAIEYDGDICRAAVKVGWVELDVDNADPRVVRGLAKSIQAYISGILNYDAKN